MAKETIADLKVQIAKLETQLVAKTGSVERLQDQCKEHRMKITNLRGEIVMFKGERDRLDGYVGRVKDAERPPERRGRERRQPPPDRHDKFHGPYDHFTKNQERKEPWFE